MLLRFKSAQFLARAMFHKVFPPGSPAPAANCGWHAGTAVHAELAGRPWDLLLLETGHITSMGAWLHPGTLLTACNYSESTTVCEGPRARGATC
jgi:hypothetical protein